MTTRKVDQRRRAVERAAVNGQERRVAQIDKIETRAVGDDGRWTFEGHAAVFDSRSEELGSFMFDGFTEIIMRGAFKPALRGGESDVRLLDQPRPEPCARPIEVGDSGAVGRPEGAPVDRGCCPHLLRRRPAGPAGPRRCRPDVVRLAVRGGVPRGVG